MKGKLGLVLGFGIGYVLGSRAGRKRYEQIKKTAGNVWNSAPVQKAAGQVSGYVGEQVSCAQNYVLGKGKALLHVATAPSRTEDAAAKPRAAATQAAPNTTGTAL